MKRVAGWLWHDHSIDLPGWIIALGAWWAITGTIRDLIHIAEWTIGKL